MHIQSDSALGGSKWHVRSQHRGLSSLFLAWLWTTVTIPNRSWDSRLTGTSGCSVAHTAHLKPLTLRSLIFGQNAKSAPTLGVLFLAAGKNQDSDFSSPPLPQRSYSQWGSKVVNTGVTHCWIVNLCLWPSLGGKRQKPSDIHLQFPEHFYCSPVQGSNQATGPRSSQAQVLP